MATFRVAGRVPLVVAYAQQIQPGRPSGQTRLCFTGLELDAGHGELGRTNQLRSDPAAPTHRYKAGGCLTQEKEAR